MISNRTKNLDDSTTRQVRTNTTESGHKEASTHILLIPGFALLAGSIALAVRTGTPWWLVLTGFVGPDLAFVLAVGQEHVAPRRIPRRVVAPYNLLHRSVIPVLVLLLSVVLHSAPTAVVAISWIAHILVDRAVGFGLRDRQGAIIPPKHIHRRYRSDRQ